jgi:hypothetical protein
MPNLIITNIGDTLPTWNIAFGWMGPGESKTIRKIFINGSSTDTIYNISLKVLKTDNNRALVENNAVLMRKYGTKDWMPIGSNYMAIGNMSPREMIVYDIRLAIPPVMPTRGKFYLGFLVRYL